MELREIAERIVTGTTLADKLPTGLPRHATDRDPGRAVRIAGPGRPPELAIVAGPHVPRPAGMPDPTQRRRILHATANHELQAVELFAWAILAYPDAPAEFRHGLYAVMREEQSHVRAYAGRLDELGMAFGELPVSGYFWGKAAAIETPAQFVCAMGLTFENANLDHTLAYAEAALSAGDPRTARIFEQVHRDEIGHVGFAASWLQRLAPGGASLWDSYAANLCAPLRPALARGRDGFDAASRLAAGLDAGFVERLRGTARRGEHER